MNNNWNLKANQILLYVDVFIDEPLKTSFITFISNHKLLYA